LRYWIVEIESHAFKEFDRIYRFQAPDEATAKMMALDAYEASDDRVVVSSLAMTDYAAEWMYESRCSDEDLAWEIVTEGWCEPCADNRWIRGYMDVTEVDIETEFERWCKERRYVVDELHDVVHDRMDGTLIGYCSGCDTVRDNERYCRWCGFSVRPIKVEELFDRFIRDEWSDLDRGYRQTWR